MMTNEQLSSWLDGEAAGANPSELVKSLARSPAQREQCGVYWLIGDCLRGDEPVVSDLSSRVMLALESEPTVLAPLASSAQLPVARWKSVAAVAAGAVFAVWMGVGLWEAPIMPASSVLAQKSLVPDVTVRSDVRLPEGLPDDRSYLMAHQASAFAAPVAGAASYIRTAGLERVGEDR
jgi:sigma-E factor negative regulatory protein RseA